MKILISTFAVALALAFTGPAFAGATAAKTEADCAKAGGTWNATTKMCKRRRCNPTGALNGSKGASASVGALFCL